VAAVVAGQADAWAAVGDVIEATRLAAKKQVAETTGDLPTVEAAIKAILDGLTWPAP